MAPGGGHPFAPVPAPEDATAPTTKPTRLASEPTHSPSARLAPASIAAENSASRGTIRAPETA